MTRCLPNGGSASLPLATVSPTRIHCPRGDDYRSGRRPRPASREPRYPTPECLPSATPPAPPAESRSRDETPDPPAPPSPIGSHCKLPKPEAGRRPHEASCVSALAAQPYVSKLLLWRGLTKLRVEQALPKETSALAPSKVHRRGASCRQAPQVPENRVLPLGHVHD